ncbi:TetR/AcrR family transcriptional regulator [Streptomyces sp. 900116325]
MYSSVGNKPAILAALLEPALTDPAVVDTLAAVAACDVPRTVIALTAEGTRITHERRWDLVYGLFCRNPPGEPAVKAVLDRGADDYIQALTQVVDRLVDLDALGDEVSRSDAIDLLFFRLGPHAWMTLVGERKWSFDQTQTWIARAACRALLTN